MTRPRVLRCCVVLLTLLLVGCAERGAGSPPSSDVLGEWELTEGTAAGVPLPLPAGGRATLVLEDGQLGGVSFCNHYSGTYRLDGDALGIDGLGGTEMGCEPDVLAAESAYVAALGAAETARIDDEDLVLTGDGTTLRFRRVPPVPTSELTGTDWVLSTLVEGQTASSVAGGSTLRLGAEGTVTGTTACRGFSGTWTASGDELTVTGLVTEDAACPEELRRQDEHELAVLGSTATVDITEDRLTLTGPSGDGLVYRDAGR
jgi:heat shock protein HslJ